MSWNPHEDLTNPSYSPNKRAIKACLHIRGIEGKEVKGTRVFDQEESKRIDRNR
jgi:hypothetical protein